MLMKKNMRLGKFKILKLMAIAGLAVQVLFATPAQAAYYATAVSTSTNLLSGVSSIASIDNFHYTITTLPATSSITVQFSQNNSTWYSAAGVLSGSTTLSTLGGADLSLSALGWSGSNFYYKMTLNATTDLSSTPTVDDVRVDYTSTSGNGQIFVVDNFGRVGIGTSAPSQQLTVFNGTTTGTYTTSGWSSSSDSRLKTNVSSLANALDKVNALQGVSFNWKATPNSDPQIGFIAQDVLNVLPEVVTGNEKDGYGIAYGNITALLTQAAKELDDKVDTQNAAINTHLATLDLKTDTNVKTVADLQTSVDSQLLVVGASINTINTDQEAINAKLVTLDSNFNSLQTKLVDSKKITDDLQKQIDELKLQNQKYTAFDGLIANISNIDNLIFKDSLGSLNLLNGKLTASEVETGVLTIKVVDLASPTIGTGVIKAGESSVIVSTKAVGATSKIFTSFEKNPGSSNWVEKVTDPATGQYVGFKILVANPTAEDVLVDWWIVQEGK
jgi:hypothetical protein